MNNQEDSQIDPCEINDAVECYMLNPEVPDEDTIRLRELDREALNRHKKLQIYLDHEPNSRDELELDGSGMLTNLQNGKFLLQMTAYRRGARYYPVAILHQQIDNTLTGKMTVFYPPRICDQELARHVKSQHGAQYITLTPKPESYLKYNVEITGE